MAFFPSSPTDGQQANVGNITYQWSTALGAWNRVGSTVNNFLVDGPVLAISGNIICSGTGTSQFNSNLNVLDHLVVSANIISPRVITNNLNAANITANGTVSVVSLSASGAITASGQINAVSAISSLNSVTAPTVTATSTLVSNGDINGGGNISVPGSVSGGTLTTLGNVSAGNVVSSGNISGTYFLGNGALLTGVVTGGGGAGNRANVTGYSGSVANAATGNTTVIMAKGYAVYKVSTTAAAWVRAYTSTARRTADSTRTQDQDPQPGAGVIVEVITTGANTVLISPSAVGFNDESPVSNVIPIAITNLSGGTANVGVTFTYLGLEL